MSPATRLRDRSTWICSRRSGDPRSYNSSLNRVEQPLVMLEPWLTVRPLVRNHGHLAPGVVLHRRVLHAFGEIVEEDGGYKFVLRVPFPCRAAVLRCRILLLGKSAPTRYTAPTFRACHPGV